MAVHELKTWPEYFGPIIDGTKTFEVRNNDRGFAVGDILRLREWNPAKDGDDRYTGREVSVRVIYILDGRGIFGLQSGCVAMGIERLDVEAKRDALTTSAADAVTVINTLADQVEPESLQSSHWARHRAESLRAAILDVTGGVMPEGTIRDTPDFPEDPEDSPFAEPSRWLSGGPPSRQTSWWLNLGDGEGFSLYDSEAERDEAANTIMSEARDEAREFGEWPDGDVDSIHSWTMGTLTVTHSAKPTGGVIDGTEVVDYAWIREDGDSSTRETRARAALARATWEIPDPDEFAIWLRAVERYEVGPVTGTTPGERLFNCAVEAGATEGKWPSAPQHRAMFEAMAAELRPEVPL